MEQTKKLKTSSDFFFFRPEKVVEVKKESVSCRNIQKADREKIRRDKLNEQTKSDKASILIDKIQTLKDLMTQVDRLKAEYVTLFQESREVLMTDALTSQMLLHYKKTAVF
uniref:Uncharacterized protein n=1 Tax=Brassica oleracea TaxID=3712 RepID=A0A3P6D223_BRAOL|nr:unnamed protein product [Brassica oleracea]